MKKSTLLLVAALFTLPFFAHAQYPSKWARSTSDTTNIFNINSGHVGIGMMSPSYKLDVNGTTRSSSIQVDGVGGIGPSGGLGIYVNDSSNAFAGQFYGITGGGLQFTNTVGTNTLTVNNSGYLGIGTTSPGSTLDVNGNGHVFSTFNVDGVSTFGDYSATSNRGAVIFTNGGISGNNFFLNNDYVDGVGFLGVKAMGGSYALAITGSGRIGIGTISPDEMLAVNGTIHTQEVKVDLDGWEDRVFKPAYELPALSSVKSYIDLNHHLPDMPSEQEIIKNGLKVGEMEKTLTKKVEELTLYLIQMKEENESLKTQVAEIKNQFNLKKTN